jgi:hypothetical protein
MPPKSRNHVLRSDIASLGGELADLVAYGEMALAEYLSGGEPALNPAGEQLMEEFEKLFAAQPELATVIGLHALGLDGESDAAGAAASGGADDDGGSMGDGGGFGDEEPYTVDEKYAAAATIYNQSQVADRGLKSAVLRDEKEACSECVAGLRAGDPPPARIPLVLCGCEPGGLLLCATHDICRHEVLQCGERHCVVFLSPSDSALSRSVLRPLKADEFLPVSSAADAPLIAVPASEITTRVLPQEVVPYDPCSKCGCRRTIPVEWDTSKHNAKQVYGLRGSYEVGEVSRVRCARCGAEEHRSMGSPSSRLVLASTSGRGRFVESDLLEVLAVRERASERAVSALEHARFVEHFSGSAPPLPDIRFVMRIKGEWDVMIVPVLGGFVSPCIVCKKGGVRTAYADAILKARCWNRRSRESVRSMGVLDQVAPPAVEQTARTVLAAASGASSMGAASSMCGPTRWLAASENGRGGFDRQESSGLFLVTCPHLQYHASFPMQGGEAKAHHFLGLLTAAALGARTYYLDCACQLFKWLRNRFTDPGFADELIRKLFPTSPPIRFRLHQTHENVVTLVARGAAGAPAAATAPGAATGGAAVAAAATTEGADTATAAMEGADGAEAAAVGGAGVARTSLMPETVPECIPLGPDGITGVVPLFHGFGHGSSCGDTYSPNVNPGCRWGGEVSEQANAPIARLAPGARHMSRQSYHAFFAVHMAWLNQARDARVAPRLLSAYVVGAGRLGTARRVYDKAIREFRASSAAPPVVSEQAMEEFLEKEAQGRRERAGRTRPASALADTRAAYELFLGKLRLEAQAAALAAAVKAAEEVDGAAEDPSKGLTVLRAAISASADAKAALVKVKSVENVDEVRVKAHDLQRKAEKIKGKMLTDLDFFTERYARLYEIAHQLHALDVQEKLDFVARASTSTTRAAKKPLYNEARSVLADLRIVKGRVTTDAAVQEWTLPDPTDLIKEGAVAGKLGSVVVDGWSEGRPLKAALDAFYTLRRARGELATIREEITDARECVEEMEADVRARLESARRLDVFGAQGRTTLFRGREDVKGASPFCTYAEDEDRAAADFLSSVLFRRLPGLTQMLEELKRLEAGVAFFEDVKGPLEADTLGRSLCALRGHRLLSGALEPVKWAMLAGNDVLLRGGVPAVTDPAEMDDLHACSDDVEDNEEDGRDGDGEDEDDTDSDGEYEEWAEGLMRLQEEVDQRAGGGGVPGLGLVFAAAAAAEGAEGGGGAVAEG